MVKKVFITVFILALIGVGTGFYLWHKPHPKAEDAKGIAIAAIDLSKEYNADEKKANVAYLDKVIEVSGTVSDVGKNQDGGVVLTMDTGDPMSGVQCTMRDKAANAAKGQNITIKGFCRGNNMGVILNDCVIK